MPMPTYWPTFCIANATDLNNKRKPCTLIFPEADADADADVLADFLYSRQH